MILPAKLALQTFFTLTQSTDNFHHFTDSPFCKKCKKRSNERFRFNQQLLKRFPGQTSFQEARVTITTKIIWEHVSIAIFAQHENQ